MQTVGSCNYNRVGFGFIQKFQVGTKERHVNSKKFSSVTIWVGYAN